MSRNIFGKKTKSSVPSILLPLLLYSFRWTVL
nr:MAG TPA: hypothetical protein [Caudoviricetes sp.]